MGVRFEKTLLARLGRSYGELHTAGTTGSSDLPFEACAKCGWLLHAYVIMSNHYHLAVETPERNLVEGMRWLQGRCAACHQERQVEGAHGPRIASRAQQRQTHGSLNAWAMDPVPE